MSTAIVSNITRDSWAEELERLFEKHYQLVYRTAYSLTGSAHDAEDILQTLFLRLLSREDPLDLKKGPEPYLYRAAFNLSMSVIRSRDRHVLAANVEIFHKPRRAAETESDEEVDTRLHHAIAKLHPSSAQIVILRYVHNKSLTEIAGIMGTSPGTVAVSLFRSRARLKRLLQAPEGER